MPRKYEQKRRAERQAETRHRIVEATVALHETVGVARTSISEIAERAGVERATVYRHFPDERSLLAACTGHYVALHPPPDPTAWERITDPGTRLQIGLREIYAYHRRTEHMTDRAERDLPEVPILAEVLAPYLAHRVRTRDVLAAGWPVAPERRDLLTAAIGHAVAFSTWRSLVRGQGLDDTQAVTVISAMVGSLGSSSEA